MPPGYMPYGGMPMQAGMMPPPGMPMQGGMMPPPGMAMQGGMMPPPGMAMQGGMMPPPGMAMQASHQGRMMPPPGRTEFTGKSGVRGHIEPASPESIPVLLAHLGGELRSHPLRHEAATTHFRRKQ